jgi:steroid delta-isomerase-like uncharacterized protein
MTESNHDAIEGELKRLVDGFFDAVSFETGAAPAYARIHDLFIATGQLIKNSGSIPEITSVKQFIESRQASVDSGALTRFHEAELTATTEVFGNVAHRFSGYFKSGTLGGVPFEAKGLVSTQFVRTPLGWKISSMAWDDERAGLELPRRYSQRPSDIQVTTTDLQAFADAWNRHDVDALMTFMTDDCVFDASAGPDACGTRYAGREAVRAAFAEVWATFPDAHWGGARHFVRGDRGVSEWTFTGTRKDGTRVEVGGCDLFTFRDGKIAAKNSYRKNRPPISSSPR